MALTRTALLDAGSAFVERWQPRLQLQSWRMRVEVAEVSDEHSAEAHYQWRFRRAVITLPPDIIERTRQRERFSLAQSDHEIVEEAVLHELLHLAEAPEVDHLAETLESLVGAEGVLGDGARNSLRDYREWMVNQITHLLLDMQARGAWGTHGPDETHSA
jgi:hypothetical protein